jgi:hypothetical protein
MDQVRTMPRTAPSSTAERLDRAVDHLLNGSSPVADRELEPLLRAGTALAAALRPLPAGERYAAHVWDRLARPTPAHRLSAAVAELASRHRPPSWLLVTGAVSSAAVGVGVTAFALWRGSRRPAARGLRIGQR